MFSEHASRREACISVGGESTSGNGTKSLRQDRKPRKNDGRLKVETGTR